MTRIAALLALILLPAAALAQEAGEVDEETGRLIRYAETTEIEFPWFEVAGELVRPTGVLVMPREAAIFKPLIDLRQDFAPEMRRSVDEVK